MSVEVRPWQPEDCAAAWAVLREASLSNVWPAFLLAWQRPAVVCVLVVVVAVCVACQATLLACFLGLTCTVCVVYCACLCATLYFLYGPNFSDMKNVQRTYFSRPGHHFWVAVADKEVVGTIAVVEKESPPKPDATGKRNPSDKLYTQLERTHYAGSGNVGTEAVTRIAWLRRMAVRKRFRGRGIAKSLVQTVIRFCTQRGYDAVFLITTEVHQPARCLYKSLGFKQKAFVPCKHLGGLVTVWTYEFELMLHKSVTDQCSNDQTEFTN